MLKLVLQCCLRRSRVLCHSGLFTMQTNWCHTHYSHILTMLLQLYTVTNQIPTSSSALLINTWNKWCCMRRFSVSRLSHIHALVQFQSLRFCLELKTKFPTYFTFVCPKFKTALCPWWWRRFCKQPLAVYGLAPEH